MSGRLDVTIVTGMSGAGRSEAAHALEDLGYFVIDNLPPMLIGKVAELARGHGDTDALRAGGRRALRRLPRRPHRRARRVAARRCHRAHPLPRRVRRRARAPVRSVAPPPPAVGLGSGERRHHPRAGAARVAEGRGRPHRRHVEPQRARAARPVARAVPGRAVAARRCRCTSCRSATSTGCRSTSTSSSTAASSRTRTGSSPCARSPARTSPCASTCSSSRARRVPRGARPALRSAVARVTSRRARRTCRSGSAAPAAGTAAS